MPRRIPANPSGSGAKRIRHASLLRDRRQREFETCVLIVRRAAESNPSIIVLKVRNTCDLATISVSFPTNDLHGLTAVQTSLPCAEDVLGGRKFVRVRGGIRTKKAHPNLATS